MERSDSTLEDLVSVLPVILAETIFSKLSLRSRCVASTVSRNWRALARRPALWQSVDVCRADLEATSTPKSVLTCLQHASGGEIRKLSMSGLSLDPPSGLLQMLLAQHSLSELEIYECDLRVNEAIFILRHCARLNHLRSDLLICGDELLMNSGDGCLTSIVDLVDDASQLELRDITIQLDSSADSGASAAVSDSAFLQRFGGLGTLLGNLRHASSLRISSRRCAQYLPRLVADALLRNSASRAPLHLWIDGEGSLWSLETFMELVVRAPALLSALTLRVPALSRLGCDGAAAKLERAAAEPGFALRRLALRVCALAEVDAEGAAHLQEACLEVGCELSVVPDPS